MNNNSASCFKRIFVIWLLFITIYGTIYGCAAETPSPPIPDGAFSTVFPTNESATSTAVLISSAVPSKPFQQINVNNFSKLFVYKTIELPEMGNKIMWLSKGDELGVLVDDQVHIYDVPSFLFTGKVLLPRRRSIYSFTYMGDVGDVMLINQDGNLLLWSLFKSESIRQYQWLNTELVYAQVSPSSNLIARSGVQIKDRKRIIEIIDLNENVIQTLVGHKNDAPILDWSPDERFLVASAIGRDASQNQILIWDIASGKLLSSLPNSTGDGGIVKFNHYGDKVVVAVGNVIRLWDMNSRSWLGNDWKYDIGESYINSLSFALSDDLIIATTSKNKVLFVNAQTGDSLVLPKEANVNIVDAALSPDNRNLAVLYENGSVGIWAVMNN